VIICIYVSIKTFKKHGIEKIESLRDKSILVAFIMGVVFFASLRDSTFLIVAFLCCIMFLLPYTVWRRWVYDKMMESIEGKPPFSYLAFLIFMIGMMWTFIAASVLRFMRWMLTVE
jgi:hypothetical protein